jgi:hypothetical protein
VQAVYGISFYKRCLGCERRDAESRELRRSPYLQLRVSVGMGGEESCNREHLFGESERVTTDKVKGLMTSATNPAKTRTHKFVVQPNTMVIQIFLPVVSIA